MALSHPSTDNSRMIGIDDLSNSTEPHTPGSSSKAADMDKSKSRASSAPNDAYPRSLEALLSEKQEILLKHVDELKELNVGQYIDLPQIIVVGDQSSGKSSVLEAISRIPFPHAAETCTTFPTELRIRRGKQSSGALTVHLRPSTERLTTEPAEAKEIRKFNFPGPTVENFEQIVDAAKNHLQKHTKTFDSLKKPFFSDTLCVEIVHPNLPPLTLVDLPGIINSKSPEAVQWARTLVGEYMSNEKSIILAVLAANYEPALQGVLDMAKLHDPLGERTICVVTKPDLAEPGTNRMWIEYASNRKEGFQFSHPWHVVKNRSGDSTQTLEERDDSEKVFFLGSDWGKDLKSEQLGIDSLRHRLSVLLEKHVRRAMPGVLTSIKESLVDCESRLSKLGDARSTPAQQKAYLGGICDKFQMLLREAVSGMYINRFFDSDPQQPGLTSVRRLRSTLQAMNVKFSKTMYLKAHAHRIVQYGYASNEIESCWPPKDWTDDAPPLWDDNQSRPKDVSLQKYLETVNSLIEQHRGLELAGMASPQLVTQLFRGMSQPWENIARSYLDEVSGAVSNHLEILLANVGATERTASAIWTNVIDPAINQRIERLMDKLDELIKPYQQWHAITYNPKFVRRAEALFNTDKEENKKHNSASTLLMNSMKEYYECVIPTFIDNVTILGIEACLVQDLENVFSRSHLEQMSDEELETLGAEHPTSRWERESLTKKRETLKSARVVLARYADTSQAVQKPEPNQKFTASCGTPLSCRPQHQHPQGSSSQSKSNTRSGGGIFGTATPTAEKPAFGPTSSVLVTGPPPSSGTESQGISFGGFGSTPKSNSSNEAARPPPLFGGFGQSGPSSSTSLGFGSGSGLPSAGTPAKQVPQQGTTSSTPSSIRFGNSVVTVKLPPHVSTLPEGQPFVSDLVYPHDAFWNHKEHFQMKGWVNGKDSRSFEEDRLRYYGKGK